MPIEKLKTFLDDHGVGYETLSHEEAYTAQEVAAAAHLPGKEVAKTVMVKVDGDMAMVVLPATYDVSLDRVREMTGAGTAELAGEAEFQDLFPDCEPGAMPPFGNLWDLPVFVDRHLREDERIAFAAGNHHELVRLAYADFERLVEPVIGELSAS
ncbi:MAG: YbaK/EbsC family protein [Longimicrobiales bacterium]|nr:YbaK/EbsC family protein [Longimicrobiales bacterium]